MTDHVDKGKFWGPIPVYVLQDHRHRAGHLRVLAAILSCPAPHYPSLNEIAERSGHTPKYCSNMVSEMVRFGTIEREQRYRSTNVYRLIGVPSFGASNGRDTSSTTVVGSDSTIDVEQKESVKEIHNTKGYGYFCSLYPKHRLGSPKRIKQYWIENDLESNSTTICNSVKELKLSESWGNDKGKYVPGALKFLEEERWNTFDAVYDPMQEFEED